VFLGRVVIGAAMGIISRNLYMEHLLRSGVVLLALLAAPLYGLTRLPLASPSLVFAGAGVALFCIVSMTVYAWRLFRPLLQRIFAQSQWVDVLVGVIVAQCVGVALTSLLMRATRLEIELAIFVGLALLLGCGTVALSSALLWLWRATAPQRPLRANNTFRSASSPRSITRKGKGVSRG
jgi:hypothetical protein